MNSQVKWESVSTPYLASTHPGEPDTWAAEAAAKGGRGSQRLLDVSSIEAPTVVSEALGLAHGETVVVRRRLIQFDDAPVELADSYYPASIAADTALAGPGKIKGGAVRVLEDLGLAPRVVEEDVSARSADANELDLLGLSKDTCLLVLARLSRTENGQPVEFSVMRMIATGRHLRYRLST